MPCSCQALRLTQTHLDTMQPEYVKSMGLPFNSWAQVCQLNTNISTLPFPVRCVREACLHRLRYIINAMCRLIQPCSLCQPWLCLLYSVLSCFSNQPILSNTFLLLSFALLPSLLPSLLHTHVCIFLPYFLLTNSVIISHAPLSLFPLISDNAGQFNSVCSIHLQFRDLIACV